MTRNISILLVFTIIFTYLCGCEKVNDTLTTESAGRLNLETDTIDIKSDPELQKATDAFESDKTDNLSVDNIGADSSSQGSTIAISY